MEKFIKKGQEDREKKKKERFLLDNKKSIVVGIGVLILFGLGIFLLKGGTKVSVRTGVLPSDVEKAVTEVVSPLYQQQKELQKQQEETQAIMDKLTKAIEKLNTNLEKSKDRTGERAKEKPLQGIIPEELLKGGVSEKPEKLELTDEKIIEEPPLFHHIEITSMQEKKDNKPTFSNLKKKKKKKPTVYIPAGSIVEGKLMYGFIAPEKGMYPPVVVEFTRPIRTANDFYIPAQKCLITTSAQYDISQGLAILGGLKSTLSCVLKNGKVVEIPVNIAVGEEIKGKTVQVGLSGKEKWLTGKDFATLTSMVSMSGMASSYRQGLVQQSITPQGNVITAIQDRGLYSVLGGVNAGVNKFVEFWLRKYDKKVPAIEVKPKEKLFVVFVNGADLGIEPKEM